MLFWRKKKKSPVRTSLGNLPGNLVNAKIASLLSGKNVNALRKVSRNMKHVKASSQMRMAKSMLPRNVVRKPVSLKLSRMTGMVPAHLPYSETGTGGRYTSGHNTIQNLLSRYTTNHKKQRRLATIQNNMEANQHALGNKIKQSLNKLTTKK